MERKMSKSDEATLNMIRKLIMEVKRELSEKKVLTENKTPEKVFNNHEKNMKEYVAKNVWDTIKNSQS